MRGFLAIGSPESIHRPSTLGAKAPASPVGVFFSSIPLKVLKELNEMQDLERDAGRKENPDR